MKQRRARVSRQVQKRIANTDKTIEQLNATEKRLDELSTEMPEGLLDELLDASAEVTDDQERDQPSSTIRDAKGQRPGPGPCLYMITSSPPRPEDPQETRDSV